MLSCGGNILSITFALWLALIDEYALWDQNPNDSKNVSNKQIKEGIVLSKWKAQPKKYLFDDGKYHLEEDICNFYSKKRYCMSRPIFISPPDICCSLLGSFG